MDRTSVMLQNSIASADYQPNHAFRQNAAPHARMRKKMLLVCGVLITRPRHIDAGAVPPGGSDHGRPQYSTDQYGSDHGSGHSTGSANTGHFVVIVTVINKTHSIIHGVFARCLDGVFGLFARSDPCWHPCVLPLIRADPGTFPVARIWIRANSGAGIRSHLPAGPPGALQLILFAKGPFIKGRGGDEQTTANALSGVMCVFWNSGVLFKKDGRRFLRRCCTGVHTFEKGLRRLI